MTARSSPKALVAAAFALSALSVPGPVGATALSAHLQEIAMTAVAEDAVTGIVLGVGLDGEAPVVAAAGQADLARGLRMTAASAWRIASIGKTFIAAWALQLAQEGKLALDDRLARFVPDIPNGERVTLRELLDHTAGYEDYITDEFVADARARPEKPWTRRELLAYAHPAHLGFAPGSRCRYSNTDYLLLGLALEIADGRPLAAALRRRFLAPLGLRHTWITESERLPPDLLVHGYAEPDDEQRPRDVTDQPWPLGGADGGIVSDAGDLIAWARALFGGRVLSPQSLAEMLRFVALPAAEGARGDGYGLGVERLAIAGVTFYGHTGSAPGYNSALLYEPATRTAAVVALNQDPRDAALLDILMARLVRALEASGLRLPRGPGAAAQPVKE